MGKLGLHLLLAIYLFRGASGYHVCERLKSCIRTVTATFSATVLFNSFIAPPIAVLADDGTSASPKVTAKVSMDFTVGVNKNNQRVQLGLYGEDAPTSTKFFLNMCQGDPSKGLSYDGAQVSKVVKDSQIEVGKFAFGSDKKLETYTSSTGVTRTRTIDKADMAKFDDNNNLRHDSAGIVSMKKGGGSFGFSIAPAPNANLDQENVVIGRVIEGMDVVTLMNEVPTSKEDRLGMKAGFSNAGKGFDPRAKIASLDRPLQKIKINKCAVDSANMAQLMKF